MLFVARIRGKSCVERRTINFLWDWLVLSVEKIEGRSGLTTTKGVARTVNILESVVRIIQNVGDCRRDQSVWNQRIIYRYRPSHLSRHSILDRMEEIPFLRNKFKAWANQGGNALSGWYRPHQQVPWLHLIMSDIKTQAVSARSWQQASDDRLAATKRRKAGVLCAHDAPGITKKSPT